MNFYPSSEKIPQTDEKSLYNARLVIYGEAVLASFPFVVTLLLIFSGAQPVSALFYTSDWSLAASLLAGQIIFRYTSAASQGKTHSQSVTLQQILFFCLGALCLITFGLYNSQQNPSTFLAYGQPILFLFVLFLFVTQGSAGQWVLELPSDPRRSKGDNKVNINNPNNEFDEADSEMARRITCAVMSCKLGVSYETARKKYMPSDGRVSPYWLSIAKLIKEDFQNSDLPQLNDSDL